MTFINDNDIMTLYKWQRHNSVKNKNWRVVNKDYNTLKSYLYHKKTFSDVLTMCYCLPVIVSQLLTTQAAKLRQLSAQVTTAFLSTKVLYVWFDFLRIHKSSACKPTKTLLTSWVTNKRSVVTFRWWLSFATIVVRGWRSLQGRHRLY